jgi:hypothetical protein
VGDAERHDHRRGRAPDGLSSVADGDLCGMPGCRQMQRFLTELALLLEELKLDGFGSAGCYSSTVLPTIAPSRN